MTATAQLVGSRAVIRIIPTVQIDPAIHNPRTDAEIDLDGLRASLGIGMPQLPVVMPVIDAGELVEGEEGEEPPLSDVYEILDGERRYRSAVAEGQTELRCIVIAPMRQTRALLLRTVANLHRKDLNPLDEAAALKGAWYIFNAQEMGVEDEANQIIAESATLRDALPALQALLDERGFARRNPPVSQEAALKKLGLGMSLSVMKKKLQVLSLDTDVASLVRDLGLTHAATLALCRLSAEDQRILIDAIQADPELARQVRSIVQGVLQKGRSITDAISIAQGRVPGMPVARSSAAPDMDVSLVEREDGFGADGDEEGDEDGTRPSRQGGASRVIDEQAAMDGVLPIIEIAQQLQGYLATLTNLTGGRSLRALPEPWGEYAMDALALIADTLQPALANNT